MFAILEESEVVQLPTDGEKKKFQIFWRNWLPRDCDVAEVGNVYNYNVINSKNLWDY